MWVEAGPKTTCDYVAVYSENCSASSKGEVTLKGLASTISYNSPLRNLPESHTKIGERPSICLPDQMHCW